MHYLGTIFSMKIDFNDKILCDHIVNKQNIIVLKWTWMLDWSRPSPINLTTLIFVLSKYHLFFHIGRLWGFKRRCQAPFMCVFVNPQFKHIQMKPAELTTNVISF